MTSSNFRREYYRIMQRIYTATEAILHRYCDYQKSPFILNEFIDRELFIVHDVFEYGLLLLAQEYSKDDVTFILSNIVENCRDKKQRLLWDLQKEAVLCITDKDNLHPFRIMVRLSSRVNIKNDAVSWACAAYWKNPASDALNHIGSMPAAPQSIIQIITKIPISHRESVRKIFDRVMKLSRLFRRQGLQILREEIDPDKIALHEVFEYGILLLNAEFSEEEIDMILTNIIKSEKNRLRKRLKCMQKEVIFYILHGYNMFPISRTIFAMSGLNDRDIRKINESSIY